MASDYVRSYHEDSWVARRWDRFNGWQHEPRSFCQFWRTVLLWATLAQVPLLGKLFLRHLWPERPKPDLRQQQLDYERFERRVKIIFGPPTMFVWWLLWPLRAAIGAGWRVAVSVVASVDERPALKRTLGNVMLGTGAAGVGSATLAWIGYAIFALWMTSVPIALIVVIGTVPALLIGGALLYCAIPPIAGTAATVGGIVWDIMVTSKHRICPPVHIERRWRL